MFPSSDDRQDYYIFGGGDFSKNLHLTLESWEGAIYIPSKPIFSKFLGFTIFPRNRNQNQVLLKSVFSALLFRRAWAHSARAGPSRDASGSQENGLV